jgi:pimeloyl-ACP methyl ester carboxylesterase
MFARSKPASQPDRHGIVQGLSPAGFHSVAYVEWGDPNATRPIVCLHGLTRQGRDFDCLAAELAALGRRVICPDLPGRGRSGRLVNPDDYSLPQYCSDMNALLARLNVTEVDWVGTSLGGLIGMVLAGFPGNVIRKLVVNDIGPYVSPTGLRRIGKYIAEMPLSFVTIADADAYFRAVLAPYGELSDVHWRHLTEHSVAWNDRRQHFRFSAALRSPRPSAILGPIPWTYGGIGNRSKQRRLCCMARNRICSHAT